MLEKQVEALLSTIARFAFAPEKMGACKPQMCPISRCTSLRCLPLLQQGHGACTSLLEAPFSDKFPGIVRGSVGVRLQVSSAGLVDMPHQLAGDNPIGRAQLAPALLRVFQAWFASQPLMALASMPVAFLFRHLFASTADDDVRLQAEVCRAVALQIESAVGIGVLAGAGGADSTGLSFNQPLAAAGDKDVQLVNYWLAGQRQARCHRSMPWSCSFDGTRVGGKPILACCFVFPTNIAFWAPPQVGVCESSMQQRETSTASKASHQHDKAKQSKAKQSKAKQSKAKQSNAKQRKAISQLGLDVDPHVDSDVDADITTRA